MHLAALFSPKIKEKDEKAYIHTKVMVCFQKKAV